MLDLTKQSANAKFFFKCTISGADSLEYKSLKLPKLRIRDVKFPIRELTAPSILKVLRI